jgi:hypothetical protein
MTTSTSAAEDPAPASTTVRAWPIPIGAEHKQPLARLLGPLIHRIFDVGSLGRVLVIASPNVPGGIDGHAELIGAIRELGVNVYATNSSAAGVPARFEFCSAGGGRTRRQMTDDGAPVVSLGEMLEACVEAGGALESGPIGLEQIAGAVIPGVVRDLFAQPPIPSGVLEPGRDWRAETRGVF